eukprot:8685416-Karenia_brevis.AAC.1
MNTSAKATIHEYVINYPCPSVLHMCPYLIPALRKPAIGDSHAVRPCPFHKHIASMIPWSKT